MSSKTLLFADDSATMRLIMEKTFHGEDFNVITVPSGQAAIEKAKELTPDIIIADAGMSGVSGYDVCDAIRNDAALSATPVVIMSGISNPYEEGRGKSVGATEHIKKPFDTTKLIDRVTELCAESARPAAIGTPSVAGVAPARPLSAAPPVTKKEAPADMPGTSATLHAFPRPSLSDEPVRPVQPVAARMPSKGVDTQPNISTSIAAASASSGPAEPEPIEIADEESGSEIQVGTLAELAQMNAHGGKVQQEVRDDAIELEGTPAPYAAPVPQPAKAPAPSRTVAEAASQAAKEIATKVEGLTSEQAQAIMALTEDVVEKVVWEVVPDLAEAIIREKLDELLKK
ncbi:MAG: response regulator [Deltaproteobacteria bacterium]|nr:response regulator [Deltaproteobacteria bacterium]